MRVPRWIRLLRAAGCSLYFAAMVVSLCALGLVWAILLAPAEGLRALADANQPARATPVPSPSAAPAPVWVHGYTRNGKWVAGYWRHAPRR